MIQNQWVPSEAENKSMRISRRKKSFLDFNSTQVMDRPMRHCRLSFEEYANLMFAEAPLHSLRRQRAPRQIRLQQRTKIVTLTESCLFTEDLRR